MTPVGSNCDDRTEAPAGTEARPIRELYVGRDRPIRLSTGHRLLHHDGKCSRPHGHNYEITVRVTGRLTAEGWVADKEDITQVLYEWDHMFLLEHGDPLVDAFEDAGDGDAVVVLGRPPTVEVMATLLEERLAEALPETVTDITVQIRETAELCTGSAL